MDILRIHKKEMVEIRTSVIKIKNVFDGHMRRLGMAELEDITIETSKTEKRKIVVKKKKEYPRTVGQVHKALHA